jgi:hypothetical protein
MQDANREFMRYVATVLDKAERIGEPLICGWTAEPGGSPCHSAAEYLIVDLSNISVGGKVKRKPLFLCWHCLDHELGQPAQKPLRYQRIQYIEDKEL